MELLGGIKKLLHDDGMTIRGVQKLLREEGVRHVASLSASLGDTNVDDSTDAGIVIDVTVETPSTGASDEAPIDLDVAQAPPENVVQFDNVHASEEIQKATDTPPAPVPDQPEEASAEIPVATKIIADVPDDPEDDEGTSGLNIISVAESLRRMADVQVADSVKTDVFAKLYDRLTRLRQRMDAPANHDSSD